MFTTCYPNKTISKEHAWHDVRFLRISLITNLIKGTQILTSASVVNLLQGKLHVASGKPHCTFRREEA